MTSIAKSWRTAALIGGLAVVLVGTFLPWVHSGEVARSSYEVAGSAGRLGLFETDRERLVELAWYLLPVSVGLVLLAMAFHRRRLAALLTGLVALLAGGGALVVLGSSLRVGVGPAVVLAGGAVAVTGAVASWWPASVDPADRRCS